MDWKETVQPLAGHFLLLNNGDGCFKVGLRQILYCSSYNSSTEFYLNSQTSILVSKPIYYYENLLLPYGFLRIHHQSIVNTGYICHFSKGNDANELTLTNGQKLAVSRARRNEVIKTIKNQSVEGLEKEEKIPVTGQKTPADG